MDPPALSTPVEHKLKAYTWNLIEGYEGNLTFRATEIDTVGRLTSAQFSGRTRFERSEGETRQFEEGLLLQEPGLQVRAAILDHGEVVLAFALEERAHINVRRNKVEAMGLLIGPWLRAFKQATLRGAPDDTLIEVAWRNRPSDKAAFLPLGHLKKEIMKITAVRLPTLSIAPLQTRTSKRSLGSRRMLTFFLSKRHSSKLTRRSPRRVTI